MHGAFSHCSVFLVTRQNFPEDRSWLKSNSPLNGFKLQLSSRLSLPSSALHGFHQCSLPGPRILVSLARRSEVTGSRGTVLYKPLAPQLPLQGIRAGLDDLLTEGSCGTASEQGRGCRSFTFLACGPHQHRGLWMEGPSLWSCPG